MKLIICTHLALFLALTVVAAGCYSVPPPKKPEEVVRTDTNPEFAKVRSDLVDIVVLAARPPEGNPDRDGPHLRRLRRLVYEGLIERGYSPYKLSYVDQTTATEDPEKRSDPDYNFKRFDEDALVVLSLNEWNERYLKEGSILVSATLSLLHSKTKDKLWMREIRHRLYKIPPTANDVSLTINEVVIDLVVKDLLADLPSRT